MNQPTKLIIPEPRREVVPAGEMSAVVSMLERAARDPNVDIDKMERLFKLRKEMLLEQQQTAYNAAMAACQAEMPAVFRDATNQQTSSTYARLETISEGIRPIYTKHGFALSFDTGDCPKEGHLRILCKVSHAAGFIEEKHFDVAIDNVGMKGNPNKTMVQAEGSTISYGRRYLTLMVFNVVLTNEDNDGNRERAEVAVDVWTALKDAAKEGEAELRKAWEAISPTTTDAILNDYESDWSAIKTNAKVADRDKCVANMRRLINLDLEEHLVARQVYDENNRLNREARESLESAWTVLTTAERASWKAWIDMARNPKGARA